MLPVVVICSLKGKYVVGQADSLDLVLEEISSKHACMQTRISGTASCYALAESIRKTDYR